MPYTPCRRHWPCGITFMAPPIRFALFARRQLPGLRLRERSGHHGRRDEAMDSREGLRNSDRTKDSTDRDAAPARPSRSAVCHCPGREGNATLKDDTEEGAMIRKLGSGEYRLYSRKKDPKTGKRRNLGTFKTREAA